VQSQTKWPTFSQLKHLAFVKFEITVLIKELKMAKVVYANVVIGARFRIAVRTEVLIVKADISALAAVAALTYTLLRSNRSLYKYFKSPSALSAKSQKG